MARINKSLFQFLVPVALAVAASAYVWGGSVSKPQTALASVAAAGTVTPKAKTSKPTPTANVKVTVAAKVGSQKELYKDKQGRPFGGNWPFINYSPTMVTGKPCLRVNKWTLDKQGYPTDRCVIQNAIDDYMIGAFASQPHNSVEEMKAIVKEFITNKELASVYLPGWEQNYLDGAVSRVCDQPMVQLLLDIDKPIRVGDMNGTPVIYIMSTETSAKMAPYACKFVQVSDGSVTQKPPVTAKDLTGPKAGFGIRAILFYFENTKRWTLSGWDRDPDRPFIDGKTLKKAYMASPYQP